VHYSDLQVSWHSLLANAVFNALLVMDICGYE